MKADKLSAAEGGVSAAISVWTAAVKELNVMTFEEFETAIYEIADTFPEDFFRELNGGVMVREDRRIHPAAADHDLFVMGEYHCDRYLGRFVVLYYGSFMQCWGHCPEDFLRERIRKVLLHEFRHHLESLAGERDLEIEDAVTISQYLERKARLHRASAGGDEACD